MGDLHDLELAIVRLQEQRDSDQRALELQATEYERRLHDLNGEYARDRTRQNDYVTVEKYEDKLKAETEARAAALLRIDEKFDDYVKRWEQRQREVDQQLDIQKGAAVEATRQIQEQARRTNRNIGLMAVTVTIVIAVANYLETF